MTDKKVKKKSGSGYVEYIPGTKGQTYYSSSSKDAPFFKFNVTDNLKKAGKRLGIEIK